MRIDRKYFANDPGGSVDQLIDAEAARVLICQDFQTSS
jgi:hypothetical protein